MTATDATKNVTLMKWSDFVLISPPLTECDKKSKRVTRMKNKYFDPDFAKIQCTSWKSEMKQY